MLIHWKPKHLLEHIQKYCCGSYIFLAVTKLFYAIQFSQTFTLVLLRCLSVEFVKNIQFVEFIYVGPFFFLVSLLFHRNLKQKKITLKKIRHFECERVFWLRTFSSFSVRMVVFRILRDMTTIINIRLIQRIDKVNNWLPLIENDCFHQIKEIIVVVEKRNLIQIIWECL